MSIAETLDATTAKTVTVASNIVTAELEEEGVLSCVLLAQSLRKNCVFHIGIIEYIGLIQV